VVTAAHCLPNLPPPHAGAFGYPRTYKNLLGTLTGQNDVSAECMFVDPVADVAVLGTPDDQELYNEAERYQALTGGKEVLRIGLAQSGPGWVLSLDGRWVPTTLGLSLEKTALSIDSTETGMSGSPILNDLGRAVGVVVVGSETDSNDGISRPERQWGQAILARNLPGWLLEGSGILRVVPVHRSQPRH
jgi:hypothetical protein